MTKLTKVLIVTMLLVSMLSITSAKVIDVGGNVTIDTDTYKKYAENGYYARCITVFSPTDGASEPLIFIEEDKPGSQVFFYTTDLVTKPLQAGTTACTIYYELLKLDRGK